MFTAKVLSGRCRGFRVPLPLHAQNSGFLTCLTTHMQNEHLWAEHVDGRVLMLLINLRFLLFLTPYTDLDKPSCGRRGTRQLILTGAHKPLAVPFGCLMTVIPAHTRQVAAGNSHFHQIKSLKNHVFLALEIKFETGVITTS